MRELYDLMEAWQILNHKRLLSLNVQRDGDTFCCIALTNPSEVVITSSNGRYHADVNDRGQLCVL